ncbi:host RNA polymerase sigma70 factor inhibitor [Pectobacterium phage Q19]|uniref:Host RNA polymerase sigma70 factor inhibitor n=1 Tax=Pectobacterium phage Q19 TaxID=2500576 RepID=A0A678ZT20_9CAUD|nr:host RNA polymerase sigma70 factor inhibitor [Pectobacterium phage Q19]
MGDYLKVLATLKSCPKTFQSNYVRNNAALVAEAASRGHISSLSISGRNAGCWEITASGAQFLNEMGGCL